LRFKVVEEFEKFLLSLPGEVKRVAIVGGSSQDPEYEIIREKSPQAVFFFFGINNETNEKNFVFIDLNEEVQTLSNKEAFDLVINSQVIEHVWNHENFFDFFENITRTNGFLWINCPASNMAHASPNYYSAGFTPSYLEENLKLRGFRTLVSASLGSKRYYFATHLARYWQNEREHRNPVIHYHFQPGSVLGILKKLLLDLPSRIMLIFVSNRITNDINYIF
jgi:SAM-dependent methyltransferase